MNETTNPAAAPHVASGITEELSVFFQKAKAFLAKLFTEESPVLLKLAEEAILSVAAGTPWTAILTTIEGQAIAQSIPIVAGEIETAANLAKAKLIVTGQVDPTPIPSTTTTVAAAASTAQ